MAYTKGIDDIEKKTQETASLASGNYIRTLKIFDGEVAFMRFLTDKQDIISAPFHSVLFSTPYGDKYRPVYCKAADGETCPYCQQGKPPGEQIFLWTYVYYILHRTQNKKLETDPNAERWTVQKIGNRTFYRQDLNKVMLFRTGPGAKGYIKNAIIQFAREYDTLCDRDYKWLRTGAGRDDTKYSLIPKDPSDITDAVKETSVGLPDLTDVVVGNITSFGGNSTTTEDNTTVNESEEDEDLSKMFDGLF